MTKNENNDSFMRDKNIVRAVDGKRKSHCAWPKKKMVEIRGKELVGGKKKK